MSAPVLVAAYVCHSCNCGGLIDRRICLSSGDISYSRSRSLAIGVAVETFLEKRMQIDQVIGESEVFLGDLELRHQLRLRHLAEERTEWLAWLEIHRTVLDLHQHIVAEFSIQRLELFGSLIGPVRALW